MVRKPDYQNTDVQKWASVDAYFSQKLAIEDTALRSALAANTDAGMPTHDVSAVQGKFLALLVKLTQATRVLEIGTLGGYSAIWMARALPSNGVITTIEVDPDRAKVAAKNCEVAQCSDKVDIRIGAATEILPQLQGPYDLIFIDADKPNNPTYLEWALKLARPGTVIVGDNVVRGGAVADEDSQDGSVRGVRAFIDMLSKHERLESTAMQTVGEKGWDGITISIVRS